MANILFATPTLLQSATLSSGQAAAAAPVSNLLHREPSVPLILTNPAAAWVGVDFGDDPPALRIVAVLYSNAGSFRVRADDTDPTSSPAYDSGSVDFGRNEAGLKHRRFRKHDWLWWVTPKTYRYWRIDFANPADADNRTIVGNLVMDYGVQPAINQAYGGGIGLIDPSRKPRSVEGQVEPLRRRPYSGVEFQIQYGSEAEMFGQAWDLDELTGTVDPVLYIRDPDATVYRQKTSVFGLMRDIGPIVDEAFGVFSKRYQIEELIP